MINEIKHLKVGFTHFAQQIEVGDNAAFYRKEIAGTHVTFAQVQRQQSIQWEAIASTIWSFPEDQMLSYLKGPVWEVESKCRQLLGRHVKAEDYLDFYDSLPTVCISTLPSYKLAAKVCLAKERDISMAEEEGVEFLNTSILKIEGKDFHEVELTLHNAKNTLFFMRTYSRRRRLELVCTGLETPALDPVKTALGTTSYSETIELF